MQKGRIRIQLVAALKYLQIANEVADNESEEDHSGNGHHRFFANRNPIKAKGPVHVSGCDAGTLQISGVLAL